MREQMYLVCYDICGDGFEKRVRRVHDVLRGFGERMQYSVFRCVLTDLTLAQLEGELERVIDHRKDQVLIAPLGPIDAGYGQKLYTLGKPLAPRETVVRILADPDL